MKDQGSGEQGAGRREKVGPEGYQGLTFQGANCSKRIILPLGST
jgi:hypothetical protein